MPSAPQKRFRAKGRSMEMARTVVLSSEAAFSLNWRTDAAQTSVSMLGKMFRTMRRPLNVSRLMSDRSAAVRVNAGAWVPLVGREPMELMGLPPRVICAIGTFLTDPDVMRQIVLLCVCWRAR